MPPTSIYRSPTADGKLEETWVAVKEQFSRSLDQGRAISSSKLKRIRIMNDNRQPLHPVAQRLEASSGGLMSYPPTPEWDDWVEYDTAHWPKKVEKHYEIIPMICFNCEAGCGLVGFVDKETMQIKALRRQCSASRQPRAQLRQGTGGTQSGDRS